MCTLPVKNSEKEMQRPTVLRRRPGDIPDTGIITDAKALEVWVERISPGAIAELPYDPLLPGQRKNWRLLLHNTGSRRRYPFFLQARNQSKRFLKRKRDTWDVVLKTGGCIFHDLTTSTIGEPIVDKKPSEQMRLVLKKELGVGGGGVALLVNEVTVKPPMRMVLKVAFNSSSAEDERTVGALVNRWILGEHRSPNFVMSMFEFVCPGLPPDEGTWKGVSIRDFVKKREEAFRSVLPKMEFSYLGVEFGPVGDARNFLVGKTTGVSFTRTVAFQLLFGLAVLHEANTLHGDIQDQNVVFSRVDPAQDGFPLYSIKWFDEYQDETVQRRHGYYDPHLSTLTEKEKGILREEKDLYYQVKFIDYGSSLRIDLETPIIFLTQKNGIIEGNPPEVIFIDRDPLELDPKSLPPGRVISPSYTRASELWSVGILIATTALNGDHPFLWYEGYGKKILPEWALPWMVEVPKDIRRELKNVFDKGPKSKQMSFFMYDSDHIIHNSIGFMWNAVEALGLPTNNEWPGIESSLLWKVIDYYKGRLLYGMEGGWMAEKSFPSLRTDLGKEIARRKVLLWQEKLKPIGMNMLLTHLWAWTPRDRADAFTLVTQHKYFSLVRKAGHLLRRQRNLKTQLWEFQEGWWTAVKFLISEDKRPEEEEEEEQ